MILGIIIFAVSVVIFMIYAILCDEKDNIEGAILIIAVLSICIIFISSMLFMVTVGTHIDKNDIIKETEVYSLNDSIGTSGNFYLGSGHIESDIYIFYLVKSENGYKIEKIMSDYVEIVESDDYTDTACIKEYSMKTNKSSWFFAMGDNAFTTKKILYVPIGTLYLNNFQIDLK